MIIFDVSCYCVLLKIVRQSMVRFPFLGSSEMTRCMVDFFAGSTRHIIKFRQACVSSRYILLFRYWAIRKFYIYHDFSNHIWVCINTYWANAPFIWCCQGVPRGNIGSIWVNNGQHRIDKNIDDLCAMSTDIDGLFLPSIIYKHVLKLKFSIHSFTARAQKTLVRYI